MGRRMTREPSVTVARDASQWTPDMPFVATTSFVADFQDVVWGRPPCCCACREQILPGQIVQWVGPAPDGLAHADCARRHGLQRPPTQAAEAARRRRQAA